MLDNLAEYGFYKQASVYQLIKPLTFIAPIQYFVDQQIPDAVCSESKMTKDMSLKLPVKKSVNPQMPLNSWYLKSSPAFNDDKKRTER